jgi:hypothetical protein
MGSNNYPGFYDEETVSALAQAFREVWTTVKANDPFMDFGRSETLRQTIAQSMLELADQGMVNVEDLRDRALAEVIAKTKLSSSPRREENRRRSKSRLANRRSSHAA